MHSKIRIIALIIAASFILFGVASAAQVSVYTDEKTGLMWQPRDNGSDISWFDAGEYCRQLTYAGFTDWRMPTQDELVTLFNLKAADTSGYYVVPTVSVSACCQWGSDRKDAKVASFDFEYGNRDWGYPMSTVDARVLAVRTIQRK